MHTTQAPPEGGARQTATTTSPVDGQRNGKPSYYEEQVALEDQAAVKRLTERVEAYQANPSEIHRQKMVEASVYLLRNSDTDPKARELSELLQQVIDRKPVSPADLALVAYQIGQPPKPAPTGGLDPDILEMAQRRAMPGGKFIFSESDAVEAVWGSGDEVLWPDGEPLMLFAPTGVGKTTLAQQLTLARIGLREEVLGYPVARGEGRVLYLAADRPRQAQRSFRRMVTPDQEQTLDERLHVWKGPLPYTLNAVETIVSELADHFGADTVVIDSTKDVSKKLSEDESGQAVNNALQHALAQGVQCLLLHHPRKGTADNRKPKALDDVYGSTWLTAGCGSVLLLWGSAGDTVVELSHLKQPLDAVGPLTIVHDHAIGMSTVQDQIDAFSILHAMPNGISAPELAQRLFGTATPDRNLVGRARRKLERLVQMEHAHKKEGRHPGHGGREPDRYYPITKENP